MPTLCDSFFLLTRDMKVEYHPLGAQSVGRRGGNLVDADFVVDVLDAVFDGTYVDVGNGRPVTKVYRYAGHGAETLQKETYI